MGIVCGTLCAHCYFPDLGVGAGGVVGGLCTKVECGTLKLYGVVCSQTEVRPQPDRALY